MKTLFKIRNSCFTKPVSFNFSNSIKDKEVAEEKFYFDKEESFIFLFRKISQKITRKITFE